MVSLIRRSTSPLFLAKRLLQVEQNLINSDKIRSKHLRLSMSSTSESVAANKPPKVLVTRPDVPTVGLELLKKKCNLVIWDKPGPIPRNMLMERIAGVDGVFCTLVDKIDEEILTAAGPQLKVVATMSVGFDHLDLKALMERNIKVGYTPGILTDATAELTVALLLATSRRLLEANKAISRGEWTSWAPTWMCGPGLSNATVGIVGLGRIGAQVAKCLKSFNVAKILYTSRTEKREAAEFGGRKVSIDDLVAQSDFVIVTCALTPETSGLFNKKMFEKMKKTAILVNTSRGPIVDQPALIEALKNGTIRAAGLDVMTPEPIPLDSELLKLDNCVILPHIGSASCETRDEMARVTALNILAVFENTQMPLPLDL
ncbi:glyoxylate reductase/hydroxypyruvate reductase-like [Neodiprion virginianus]|uniref:glyoxylate reductase/hydroxypyruvate reductase-like n=1 Tax=Neodiprion virginianus TaxID=2961670 RepID=UPI001EE6D977|nr:glyoxylate reductase/hydroxypyruvate reductase-like [Neodiprion virginianus]